MVSSQQAYASEAGLAVLKRGGNAVDAAVTMGFVLAVSLPRAGNLGGGGFMLVHMADSKETVAIDYREKAPKKSEKAMFLDPSGNVDSRLSQDSLLASGVPGTVAGLALSLEKYGTISLREAISPAIRLAERGIIVDDDLAASLERSRERLGNSELSMRTFFKSDGSGYAAGDKLVQRDLATSLKLIARSGPDAFYSGKIAQKIDGFMRENGGLISLDDLRDYRAVVRKPIRGTYRGYEILSMPPPSSGGVILVHLLNLLERYPIGEWGHNSDKTVHTMTEAMRLSYADRSQWLGDADFVDVPVSGLISKSYAEKRARYMYKHYARPSRSIGPSVVAPKRDNESSETTHFSVVDQWGNAVSNTYTLNFSYGNGMMVPGTGILLNNEMDDFSAKPGAQNAYGLIGSKFNAIAPEKRMLSSMAPTIVLKDDEVFLVTGSPGGSRIITTVAQIIMNVIDHGMNIADASHALRVHHQWWPDEIRVEQGFNTDTMRLLKARRHQVVVKAAMGSSQSIMRFEGLLLGAADPRKPGALSIGY